MADLKVLLVFAVVFSSACVVAFGQAKASNELAERLKRLCEKGEAGEKEKGKLLQERTDIISGLTDILKDAEQDREVRIRAAYLLGEYRAEEAVPVLFDNLRLTPTIVIRANPYLRSPCMGALVKIGKKASVGAVERIPKPLPGNMATKTKQYIRYLYYLTLIRVEGKETAEFMIREKLKELKGKEKERAQAFLEEYFSEEGEKEEKKEEKQDK